MLEITFTQFTPAQAENITGMSVSQQRNLRRHGYLKSTEGHARFDIFDLARLFVIQTLSDKGVGPSHCATGEEGQDIASICAKGILWSIFDDVDAYEGDHRTFTLSGPPVEPFDEDLIEKVVVEAQKRGMKISADDLQLDWKVRAERLKKASFLKKGLGRVYPARFFIWWADGTELWTADIAEAFENSSSDKQYHGAAIVMDQEALGSMLCERANVAFAHVEAVGA
ncbi:hypothetical protein [Maritalea sp.]|uniref:hypothetical protein n=1 Tax=Maritalea sp. TaxID=2003361 RepID=UPI003EF9ED5F